LNQTQACLIAARLIVKDRKRQVMPQVGTSLCSHQLRSYRNHLGSQRTFTVQATNCGITYDPNMFTVKVKDHHKRTLFRVAQVGRGQSLKKSRSRKAFVFL
jgi:hypothetical protein